MLESQIIHSLFCLFIYSFIQWSVIYYYYYYFQDISICLKWPNDIYYGKEVKIGGVVISSSAIGNTLNAVIGEKA